MKFPQLSSILVDELERRFPELIYEPGDTLETMAHRAGQRSVVTMLKQWRARPEGGLPSGPTRGEGRRVRQPSGLPE